MPALRRAVSLGLTAGLAIVIIGAVGMLEAFSRRDVVTDLVSLGRLTVGAIILVAGFEAARARSAERDRVRTSPALALPTGVLAGVSAGTLLAGFVLLVETIDVRDVFQSVTPRMLDVLTFELEGAGLGALALVAGGAFLGLLGSILAIIPPLARRSLVSGLLAVLLISLMEPFLRVALIQLDLNELAGFIYESGGLRLESALLIFVLAAVAAASWDRQGGALRARMAGLPRTQRRSIDLVVVALVGVFLLVLPQIVGSFLSEVLGTVGLYILLGLGLNIVVGFAGLLDLGYVAFYAVGAYTTAVLTSLALDTQLSFWLALPIVIAIAALAGLMIGAPVLRLRGDYLAIVTLGFGEIARILAISDWMEPVLGGAQGILGVPAPSVLGITLRDPQTLYYLILAFCVVAALIALSLADSRVGRAWNAMREDEQVAEATGINTTNYKLLAFATGGVFGCLAGALFAVKIGSVFAQSFPLLVSITALALIILGGMGSIAGVIVGAIVLVGLPELLREFAEFRLLIYGAVLVGMMLLRPEGLLPSATRQRELHHEEEPEEQYGDDAGMASGAPVITTGRESAESTAHARSSGGVG